jgi:hypothetical protein
MERLGYACGEIDGLLARGILYKPPEDGDYRWRQ